MGMRLSSFFKNCSYSLQNVGIFTTEELKAVAKTLKPLADMPIEKIITVHLEDLFLPKPDGRRKEALLVKRLFKTLVGRGYISYNPAEHMQLPFKKYVSRRSTFTNTDVENVLQYFLDRHTGKNGKKTRSAYDLEMYRYVLYLAGLGQRRAELTRLRVKDILLKKEDEEIVIVIERSKGMHDRRTLSFNDITKQFKDRVIEDMKRLRREKKGNDLVFSFSHTNTPSGIWKSQRDKIDIRPELHLHDIRRLYIRSQFDRNVKFSTVQLALGHRNGTTVLKHYINIDQSQLIRMVQEEREKGSFPQNGG